MTSKQIAKPSRALAWLICSMGMLFYGYEFLLRISPSVMEPELRAHFGITGAAFGSLVGLFYMAYTPMQLFVGAVIDLYGLRKILTFAIATCALGAYIFVSSHSLLVAGMGRFMIGFGSAFAFVGALKLASLWLPSNRFATFAGMVSALGMLGGMVGDLGLTSMVQRMGWQQTMYYGVILGVLLTPLVASIVRDQPANEGEKLKFSVFFKEYLRIILNSQIWLSGLIACMLYLALSAFAEMWGIPYLRAAFGFSPEHAAFANSMVFFGWLFGCPLMGWISDHFGTRRRPLMLGGVVAAISISTVLYLPSLSYYSVVVLLLIFGLATSTELICFAVGHESAPRQVAATAIAFVNLLTMLGGFIFQPAIGKFLDMAWSGTMANGIRVYTTQDYRVALSVLPLAMIISVIISFILRESYQPNLPKAEL